MMCKRESTMGIMMAVSNSNKGMYYANRKLLKDTVAWIGSFGISLSVIHYADHEICSPS